MPARRLINLLPQDPFTSSVVGRVLLFSITIGRYVVVFTELVVIMAFLSRFYLDRQIADLNDRVREQLAVINASREFEQNFRFSQMRLATVNKLVESQFGTTAFLDRVTPFVPSDVSISRFLVQDGTLQISGISATGASLRRTLVSLQESRLLKDISLTSIVTGGEATGGGLRFSLNATIVAGNFKSSAEKKL